MPRADQRDVEPAQDLRPGKEQERVIQGIVEGQLVVQGLVRAVDLNLQPHPLVDQPRVGGVFGNHVPPQGEVVGDPEVDESAAGLLDPEVHPCRKAVAPGGQDTEAHLVVG